jgi:hypothetical protein
VAAFDDVTQIPPGWEDVEAVVPTVEQEAAFERIIAEHEQARAAGLVLTFDSDEVFEAHLDRIAASGALPAAS